MTLLLAVSDKCPFCSIPDDANVVLLKNEHCQYLQDPRYQGVLRHSGIIIPRRHARSVFDLTPQEVSSTFTLLNEVRALLDETAQPDGYTVG